MITEDYVSFEVAKLLKEKGFNCSCRRHYNDELEGVLLMGQDFTWNDYRSTIAAPTQQVAVKWLREIHHIDIEVRKNFNSMKYKHYIWKDCKAQLFTGSLYSTYEESCAEALKYCLNNLV